MANAGGFYNLSKSGTIYTNTIVVSSKSWFLRLSAPDLDCPAVMVSHNIHQLFLQTLAAGRVLSASHLSTMFLIMGICRASIPIARYISFISPSV